MTTSKDIIEKFHMLPHPEGGFYVETFRSDVSVKVLHNDSTRSASTAIYFLMTSGNISRLHRIQSDEVWHFYLGGSITVIELCESEPNHFKSTVIGNKINDGETVQYCVKRNTWFGSFLNEGSEFCLVGCTVSPGFTFEDFELGSNQQLINHYPKAEDIIDQLTIGLP